MPRSSGLSPTPASRPARASWIEILIFLRQYYHLTVEAREGLVDRNNLSDPVPLFRQVEAREGLVDRNIYILAVFAINVVEAREGLVDRNCVSLSMSTYSLSRGPRGPRG